MLSVVYYLLSLSTLCRLLFAVSLFMFCVCFPPSISHFLFSFRNLMKLFLDTFPPSPEFENYVEYFLRKVGENKYSIMTHASNCHRNESVYKRIPNFS
jgi:hypothetical protein